MAEPQGVTLVAADRPVGGARVVTARGRVSPQALTGLRDGLVKLLVDGGPVLLDVADLRLDWAPAPEVFVTAVTAAGGWPLARLVLCGADRPTAERLRACRVPDSVPLAGTAADAAELVDARPARLAHGVELPAGPSAVPRAGAALHETCRRWGVDPPPGAATVVTELVANAVGHARTPARMRLVLDRSGLRVSVRDGSPGPLPVTVADPGQGGLRTVARLSRTWGVLHHVDGKAVWAQVPLTRARTAPPAPARRRDRRAPTTPGAGLRRRRFATLDPEHAHAFLRTVYGEHTLRLGDAAEPPGFHLEYHGTTGDRFAVEHLRHGATVESGFAPGETLVVVHPLAGSARVRSRREELSAAPGDPVLWAPAGDLRVASTDLDVELVRLPVATVARVVADLTGIDAPSVPFRPSRAVSAARAAYWRATVAHLRRDVLSNAEAMASPLARTAALRTLVAALVVTFPNPVADAAGPSATAPSAPRAVRRAIAFIEERAGDDIGLADIAAAAGIGARGLQLAFRRHADLTPLEYLRGVRLARAHRDLQAAHHTEATVGAVARRWGFAHHANFSTLYLRRYGCSPSITLRS